MTHLALGPLVDLLHLCDSLFPIGAFAHSDGLEAAVAERRVIGASGLRQWLDATLHEALADVEAPVVLGAWRAFDARHWSALPQIDAEMHALRPSAAGRQASRAMGTRLLLTWRQTRSTRALEELCAAIDLSGGVTLPVAFGIVCAAVDIEVRGAVAAFMYTRLAATSSAAMRLMAIGQHEAHRLLADILQLVPAAVDRVLERGERPGGFMPALDLTAMSQQYVYSRLFRS